MVASTNIQMLTNASDQVSVITEFMRNPAMVKRLEEEVRKLNALTADEEAKLHEAKIVIQQRDKANLELKNAIAEKIAIEKSIADKNAEHHAWVLAETKKIEDAHAVLAAAKAEHEAEGVRLTQRANKLKETAAQMQGLTVSVG